MVPFQRESLIIDQQQKVGRCSSAVFTEHLLRQRGLCVSVSVCVGVSTLSFCGLIRHEQQRMLGNQYCRDPQRPEKPAPERELGLFVLLSGCVFTLRRHGNALMQQASRSLLCVLESCTRTDRAAETDAQKQHNAQK